MEVMRKGENEVRRGRERERCPGPVFLSNFSGNKSHVLDSRPPPLFKPQMIRVFPFCSIWLISNLFLSRVQPGPLLLNHITRCWHLPCPPPARPLSMPRFTRQPLVPSPGSSFWAGGGDTFDTFPAEMQTPAFPFPE